MLMFSGILPLRGLGLSKSIHFYVILWNSPWCLKLDSSKGKLLILPCVMSVALDLQCGSPRGSGNFVQQDLAGSSSWAWWL